MPCTANWLLKMFKTQPRYLGKRCLPNIACCSSLASVKSRIFLLAPSDAIPCTLLTNLPQESCPLYPRKRTCAVQEAMSAMGQKQTCAAHGSCPPRAQRRKSFQGLLGRQIGHWRSRYRVFDHRGGRRGVRRDPDIIGRQAKSYSAAALCFSPAIASLIAVCTSQWRDRTTASMRSRNSRRLSGGSSSLRSSPLEIPD